jgi:hypothetical protein
MMIMMIMMIILILLSSACTILYTYRPQTCIAPGMPIAVPMPEVLTAMSEMPDALPSPPHTPFPDRGSRARDSLDHSGWRAYLAGCCNLTV